MSEKKLPDGVYGEEPNIVHIVFKDQSGEAERWVTGKTLDEVLDGYGLSLFVPGPTKARKPRRTKAQMQAAESPYEPEAASQEVPPPHNNKKAAAWV